MLKIRKFHFLCFSLKNENGVATVFALLALAVLSGIGIYSMTTSQIETQVATNDVLYKKAFYAAEGGTGIGWEMIEQNLSCMGQFPSSALNSDNELELESASGTSFFRVTDPDFSLQESSDMDDDSDGTLQDAEITPSDTRKDLWFGDSNYSFADYDTNGDGTIDPANDNMNLPHTNVLAFGDTELSTGSAILMASGYAGKGKGAGAGGGKIVYQIHSRNEYPARNSDSHILVEYRHLIGQEGDCEF